MIRIITLAATAALIALPASAQSIHISTVGKTPDQVRAEVYKAATTLCAKETLGATFPIYEMRICVENTTRTTLAQSSFKALVLASR